MADAGGPSNIWTVTSLVAHIKRLIDRDEQLRQVWVMGELSGVKSHRSGHWYFILKDEAQIRAVMFRREAASLRFTPQDGQQVLALGRVAVYERDGQTQLYVQHLEPAGVGQYFLELERLRARLQAEGIFSRPKRALPRVPSAVGVVTSPSGAAWHDIRTVAHRRFPGLPLVLMPVPVQGDGAAAHIVAGLRRIAREPGVAVVILARGGGSREDLSVFNDEQVVRAVAAMPLPVVSAVGHEVDVSLTDLAADVRAATPSHAAELAVPEREELARAISHWRDRMVHLLGGRIRQDRQRVVMWTRRGALAGGPALLASRRMLVARLEEQLEVLGRRGVSEHRRRADRVTSRLAGLNPLSVLERGFSLVTDHDGRPTRPDALEAGQSVRIDWHDGAWQAALTERLETGTPQGKRKG